MDEIDRPLCWDKPALAAYNLKDCELVTRIFHKPRSCCVLLERATINGTGRSPRQFRSPHSGIFTFRECTAPALCRANLGEVPLASRRLRNEFTTGLYDSVLVLDYKACTRRLSARFD